MQPQTLRSGYTQTDWPLKVVFERRWAASFLKDATFAGVFSERTLKPESVSRSALLSGLYAQASKATLSPATTTIDLSSFMVRRRPRPTERSPNPGLPRERSQSPHRAGCAGVASARRCHGP